MDVPSDQLTSRTYTCKQEKTTDTHTLKAYVWWRVSQLHTLYENIATCRKKVISLFRRQNAAVQNVAVQNAAVKPELGSSITGASED